MTTINNIDHNPSWQTAHGDGIEQPTAPEQRALYDKMLQILTRTVQPLEESEQRSVTNLEHLYLEEIRSVDTKIVAFEDYLTPNEGNVIGVKAHLDRMLKGLIVSTGTERSFYDLLLSDENKCTGLVIRDINPKVKAYIDCAVLLLRLAVDRNDFLELSSTVFQPELTIKTLLARLESNITIPPEMKQYYRKYLNDLVNVYFNISNEKRIPPGGDNSGTEYRKDDPLFNKLKKHADEGKIIATVGDIGDLKFLSTETVAVVDTSNIQDYSLLDIKVNNRPLSRPRIIFTVQDPDQTNYLSFIPGRSLNPDERNEFRQLESDLTATEMMSCRSSTLSVLTLPHINPCDKFNWDVIRYSPQTLEILRAYNKQNIISIRGLGLVDMRFPNICWAKLNHPLLQINEITNHRQPTWFVEILVEKSALAHILPERYLELMKVPGWKSAWEKRWPQYSPVDFYNLDDPCFFKIDPKLKEAFLNLFLSLK